MSTKTNIVAVIAFVIGALFGTGAIWEMKKNELEKIRQGYELRKSIENQLVSVIELTNKYLEEYKRYEDTGDSNNKNKAYEYKVQLDMAKENLITFEKKLAIIENREPRDIQTWFIPTRPPGGITVTD
jgi:hypothetical protein